MQTLDEAGFSNIRIFDDANYADRQALPAALLEGADPLPAKIKGYDLNGTPFGIPSREILDRAIGYNWIAVGTKQYLGTEEKARQIPR
jgi:hypothetical protein